MKRNNKKKWKVNKILNSKYTKIVHAHSLAYKKLLTINSRYKFYNVVINDIIHKYDNEIKKLKHIILSHHGKLEWGSPTTPKIPEAYFIHMADKDDSEIEAIIETLQFMNVGDMSQPLRCLDDGKVIKL